MTVPLVSHVLSINTRTVTVYKNSHITFDSTSLEHIVSERNVEPLARLDACLRQLINTRTSARLIHEPCVERRRARYITGTPGRTKTEHDTAHRYGCMYVFPYSERIRRPAVSTNSAW